MVQPWCPKTIHENDLSAWPRNVENLFFCVGHVVSEFFCAFFERCRGPLAARSRQLMVGIAIRRSGSAGRLSNILFRKGFEAENNANRISRHFNAFLASCWKSWQLFSISACWFGLLICVDWYGSALVSPNNTWKKNCVDKCRLRGLNNCVTQKSWQLKIVVREAVSEYFGLFLASYRGQLAARSNPLIVVIWLVETSLPFRPSNILSRQGLKAEKRLTGFCGDFRNVLCFQVEILTIVFNIRPWVWALICVDWYGSALVSQNNSWKKNCADQGRVCERKNCMTQNSWRSKIFVWNAVCEDFFNILLKIVGGEPLGHEFNEFIRWREVHCYAALRLLWHMTRRALCL